MRLLRCLLGAVLWVLGVVVGLLGVLLSVTVLLLPLGIPLLLLARRLFTSSVRLFMPGALTHPAQELRKSTARKGKNVKGALPDVDLHQTVKRTRSFVKKQCQRFA